MYESETRHRQEGGRETTTKLYFVPLGAYFKPRRQTKRGKRSSANTHWMRSWHVEMPSRSMSSLVQWRTTLRLSRDYKGSNSNNIGSPTNSPLISVKPELIIDWRDSFG